MRHRVDTFKIGRSGAHRRSMLANMVSSLFLHGEIRTTLVKAKEARRVADRMITLGKKGDLHHRRLAVSHLRDKSAVKLLFDEIAPTYAGRNGGYTRIYKLGTRIGDGSEMCILQLVESDAKVEEAKKAKTAKAEPKAKAPKAEKAKEAKAELKAEAKAEPKAEAKAEPKAKAPKAKAPKAEKAEEPKAEEAKAEKAE